MKTVIKQTKRILSLLLIFMFVLSALSSSFTITVKADPSNSTLSIQTFNVSLVYGAEKEGDQYIWRPASVDSNHLIVYRINYAFSGVGDISRYGVKVRVPQKILRNRDGNFSDNCDLSVPHQDQAEDDTDFAYYEDGDDFVITNLIDVPAAQDGYFEVSYSTKQLTYDYADSDPNAHVAPVVTVTLSREGENDVTQTVTAPRVIFDTTAEIQTTFKSVGDYKRPLKWDNSWGDRPADADDYDYLI